MSDLIEHCLATVPFHKIQLLEDLEATDAETRRVARTRVPA